MAADFICGLSPLARNIKVKSYATKQQAEFPVRTLQPVFSHQNFGVSRPVGLLDFWHLPQFFDHFVAELDGADHRYAAAGFG